MRLRHSRRRFKLLATFSKTLNDSNHHISLINKNDTITETNSDCNLALPHNVLENINETEITNASKTFDTKDYKLEVYKGILILSISIGVVTWLFLLYRLIRLCHLQFWYSEL